MENNEIWKDIPFDSNYMISTQGRVFSKRRIVNCGPSEKGSRTIGGIILSPKPLKSTGYVQVALSGRKIKLVHYLVAITFLSRKSESLVVNHKNGVRSDNRLSNLEWVTHSENHKHSYRELGRINSCKGKFSLDHPTSKSVVSFCPITNETIVYPSAMDAVRVGFDSPLISRCCNGKIKTHKGLVWNFYDSDLRN